MRTTLGTPKDGLHFGMRLARGFVTILALLMVWQLASSVQAPVALAERSVEWAQFDVGINLLTDGRLAVTELSSGEARTP